MQATKTEIENRPDSSRIWDALIRMTEDQNDCRIEYKMRKQANTEPSEKE